MAVLRRKGILALCVALSILALGVSASAQHPTILTFDPPGSGYTAPNAINPAGKITGLYFDASGGHGFLPRQTAVSPGSTFPARYFPNPSPLTPPA